MSSLLLPPGAHAHPPAQRCSHPRSSQPPTRPSCGRGRSPRLHAGDNGEHAWQQQSSARCYAPSSMPHTLHVSPRWLWLMRWRLKGGARQLCGRRLALGLPPCIANWGGGVEEGGWVWVVGGWGEPPAAAAPGSARGGQRTWQQATIRGATHPACQPAARARRRRATRPAALPLPACPAPPVPARRAACGCRAAPLRRGLQEGGAELINPMMQPPPSPQGRIHTCARTCGTSNLQLEHRAAEAEAVVSQQGSHPGLVADRAEGLHGACELEGRGACLCACGQGGGRRG